jgi:hypothetical protein
MAKATFLKVWASVLAAVLAAGLLAATTFTPGAAAQDAACEGDIVLDPGHSGSDTGAAMVASFTTFSGGAEQMNQLLWLTPRSCWMPLASRISATSRTTSTRKSSSWHRWRRHSGGGGTRHHRRVAWPPDPSLATRCRELRGYGALAARHPHHYGALSLESTVEAVLNLWPVCLFFGGLVMLCSALFHRRVLAVAFPAFLLFAMYVVDAVGRASEDLRPASVFYYYGSAIEESIDWAHFGGVTLVALTFVLLAVLAFQRRDIYT